MCRGLIIIVLLLHCCNAAAFQQAPPAVLDLTISEMDSALVVGPDRSVQNLRIGVSLSLRNLSSTNVQINVDQFQLLANDKPLGRSASGVGLVLQSGDLEPQQTRTGWIWFMLQPVASNEPSLVLTWNHSSTTSKVSPDKNSPDVQAAGQQANNVDKLIRIDLNKEVRRLCAFETALIGPDAGLEQITANRALDALAAWAILEELQKISANGTQRIVIAPADNAKLNVTGDFVDWLESMAWTPDGPTTSSSPLWKPGIVFYHIAIAGFVDGLNGRSSGQRRISRHQVIDDAVYSALTPVYRFVPIHQAISDLQNLHPGVRRAAMAGAVDRLSSEQATAILDQARTGSETVQMEIASYLYLVPGRNSVDALKDMCLGENPKVAAEALRSLLKSRDDSAAAAMAEVWNASEKSPSLRAMTIDTVMETADDRWVPLVSDFVTQLLTQATQPNTSLPSSETISNALEFLQVQKDSRALMAVEQELLNIRSRAAQDLFLAFLLRSAKPSSEKIIRQCVSQRLHADEVSKTVNAAAIQFRDSSWTQPLLKAFRAGNGKDPSDFRLFQAILACASSEDLDEVMAESRSDDQTLHLEPQHQFELLKHLAQIDHPEWRKLAEQCIETAGQRKSEIIPILAIDASEESLLILRKCLQSYVNSLEGTLDAAVDGQQFFETLTGYIATFSHPECRRMINRLSRDSNTYVSERVTARKRTALSRSPARNLIQQELTLRREGKTKEALEVLNQCIEMDPMTAELLLHRSSVLLHEGRFSESMADLRTADQLSPEDVEVQSMIALVMVRQDEIEAGLKLAEATIAMAPKDWTSLYNGACTFARATESKLPTAEMKKTYADRAMLLLQQTAELKFDDPDHLVKDEDLFSLHQHAEWEKVVTLIKANVVGGLNPTPPRNPMPGAPLPVPVPPNNNPK